MFSIRIKLALSFVLAILTQRPPKHLLWVIEVAYISIATAIFARLFTITDEVPRLLGLLFCTPFDPLLLVLASYLLLFYGAAHLFRTVAFGARAKRAIIYGA